MNSENKSTLASDVQNQSQNQNSSINMDEKLTNHKFQANEDKMNFSKQQNEAFLVNLLRAFEINQAILAKSVSGPINYSVPPPINHISASYDGMLNNLMKLQRSQSEFQSHASRYKTELCRPFEETGECKYADKCQFAHGMHELRHLQRHHKYKTEYCRTFHSIGFCPYGTRCHFIHSSQEMLPGNNNIGPNQTNLSSPPIPIFTASNQNNQPVVNTFPFGSANNPFLKDLLALIAQQPELLQSTLNVN